AGISKLLENPEFVFLEVGSGTTLSSLGQMHVPRQSARTFVSSALARPEPGAGDWTGVLTALGRLWQAGVNPDWAALHAGARRKRLALPSYPFERERYFIEPGTLAHAVVATPQPEAPAEAEAPSPALMSVQGPDVGQALRDIVAALSGVNISSADGSRTFLELGFDSLFLAQLSRSIEQDFGV